MRSEVCGLKSLARWPLALHFRQRPSLNLFCFSSEEMLKLLSKPLRFLKEALSLGPPFAGRLPLLCDGAGDFLSLFLATADHERSFSSSSLDVSADMDSSFSSAKRDNSSREVHAEQSGLVAHSLLSCGRSPFLKW